MHRSPLGDGRRQGWCGTACSGLLAFAAAVMVSSACGSALVAHTVGTATYMLTESDSDYAYAAEGRAPSGQDPEALCQYWAAVERQFLRDWSAAKKNEACLAADNARREAARKVREAEEAANRQGEAEEQQRREAEARTHDEAALRCSSEACAWDEARKAAAVVLTPARADAAKKAREKLGAALSFTETPGEEDLARLARLRTLSVLAVATLALDHDDGGIRTLAKTARELAAAQRAKVSLIGADAPVWSELLGTTTTAQDGHAIASFGSSELHVATNKQGRCTGIYVVGAPGTQRPAIGQATAAAALAQAVGHTPRPMAPTSSDGRPATTKWFEGKVPVVARWLGGELMELRVGEATP